MPEPKQPSDGILFSANPNMVVVDDAMRHLAEHEELYWGVGFRIDKNAFSYPIYGFIHIRGERVEYRATIRDIVPFSFAHYEDEAFAATVKPQPWIREWKEDPEPKKEWRNSLVMTEIIPFSYDTYSFEKYDGAKVKHPPQGFIRVRLPRSGQRVGGRFEATEKTRTPHGPSLAEKNLEDFIVHQLEEIEPGLHLVERQLSTPAGRLDLLCKDASNNYVVVELKRTQGTDQVVGQILRYMGWLREAHPTETVRGIVIVGEKDRTLSYAAMAVPNVRVKEFKILID